MKVLITENKLFDSIYSYIDGDFNKDDINWIYGLNDSENEYDELEENENFIIFYNGDWQGEEDSDSVFHYFDVDFYDKNDPSHKPFRDKTPILEVLGEYGRHLDAMFDNHWHEPMKKWFQDNFNLPVKTLSTYYNYENYN